MSMKRWRQSADETAVVEVQNAEILNTFKQHKIEKEFGKRASEELFKPITKRLDKQTKRAEKKAKEEVPDYGMDEFDRLNPFDEDFRPDEESPTPRPPPTPPLVELDGDDDDDELLPPPPPIGNEVLQPQPATQAKWGTLVDPGLIAMQGSTDLGTLNTLLAKYGKDPNYMVKSKKSKFRGYTIEDIRRGRDKILERQGELAPQTADEEWEEAQGETEGSGVVDVNALVNQLYISLESIKAGNTSLRQQVKVILSMLVSQGVITKTQARKISQSNICTNPEAISVKYSTQVWRNFKEIGTIRPHTTSEFI